MTTVSLKQVPLSVADQVCSCFYYIGCAAADLEETVSKVAFAVFATLTAGVFLGRSEFLNGWVVFAWKDAFFAGRMLGQSLRGIIDPLGAYLEKVQLQKGNCINGFFNQKIISSLTHAECTAGSLLFAGKGFAEISSISMSAFRMIGSLVLYVGSLGNAESMAVLAWSSCLSLVRSITVAGACFYSAAAPRQAYLPLNVEYSSF